MERKTLVLLSLLFLAAFGLRFFPVNVGYHYWDQTVYLQQGEIIAGESPDNYSEFDFRPPIFSFLLAPAFLTPAPLVSAHIIVALMSSLGVPAVFLLGREMFDRFTGLISSLAYASSPLLLDWSHDILVDPLLPLFWVFTAYLVYRGDRGSKLLTFLTGLSVSLAVLTKFTSLVLLPVVAAVMLLDSLEGDIGEAVSGLATSYQPYIFLSGFILGMAPYLLWSLHSFGSIFHTFGTALSLSGATDPFLTYLVGSHTFLLPVFLLGLVLLVPGVRKWGRREYYIPLLFALGLLIPLQFVIGNRELRFMTPLIPFLSLLSARGIVELRSRWREEFSVLFGVLLFLSMGIMVFQLGDTYSSSLVEKRSYPPVYNASQWLKENTGEEELVYADEHWPPLGYYSKRKIVVVPERLAEEGSLDRVFDRPGYLYHHEKAYRAEEVEDYIESSGSFRHVKTFGGGAELYYYGG